MKTIFLLGKHQAGKSFIYDLLTGTLAQQST